MNKIITIIFILLLINISNLVAGDTFDDLLCIQQKNGIITVVARSDINLSAINKDEKSTPIV